MLLFVNIIKFYMIFRFFSASLLYFSAMCLLIFFLSLSASISESSTVLNIIKSVFKKLCETMEPKELNLVWSCLYKEVHECVNTENIRHLRRILSVLVSAIKVQKGQNVSGKLQYFVSLNSSFYSFQAS